jgi:hypothetical protein
MKLTILSVPMIFPQTAVLSTAITLNEARELVADAEEVINYCGHSTMLALGIEPATTRDQCESYTDALVLKPNARLEFGREYSVEEIMDIGVTAVHLRTLTPLFDKEEGRMYF